MGPMKKQWLFGVILVLCCVQLTFADSSEKISVNFDNISIQSALKWLAKFNKKNYIVSPMVKDDVSLHLEDVTSKQALDALLKTQGLSRLNEGNVVFIAPLEEIARRKKQLQVVPQALQLTTEIIKLKYAKASDMAKLLKNKGQGIMSKEGQVSVDERTNSLLIKESAQQIKVINSLIKKLDIAVPQVAIETRIVNIDDDYEKELGVKFGITGGRHLSGTLKGANDIAGGESMSNVNPEDRLNVDLPTTMRNSGRIGLALFKLTQGTLIDLELSALESEGRAEIISTPRLLTANQQQASIESGEEIPYQEQASAQGATKTAFKKAVLSLKVTPQITPDKKIILYLQINQDKRSSREVLGVPAIDTRQIKTQVLVNNGQTVVLGGIYEQTRLNSVERVPFFSDLPGIGVLFRHRKVVNNRRELLVFVTPNIVT